jgi:GH24 family phage-related lysozyme (muramidase)
MNISQKGIDLIKSFEGLVLHAYKPVSTERYFTIGYGHYGSDVKQNQTITQKQAEEYLKQDLQKFVYGVSQLVKVSLNQNQFDALVSFAYNCGVDALRTSDLLMKLNKGEFVGASKEFDRWVHSGKVVIQGLVNRRNKEKVLFLTPIKVAVQTTQNYTIRSGENLTKISKRFGTTVNEIMKLNPAIKNKELVFDGQVIKIPKQ